MSPRPRRRARAVARLLFGLTAAVAGLVLVGHGLFARREPVPRAQAPSDPGVTRFLETRSGRVHILDLPAREAPADGAPAPAVLLLHGTGRSVADWQEGFGERLARHHRVVGMDAYGNGLSDRLPGFGNGIASWARQAVDVLDALGIDRVTVVGHSAGGCVAAIFAADHAERTERAVFIGHGTAIDPVQIVPVVPGLGELKLGLTDVFSDTFSPAHARRLEAAWAIRDTRAAMLVFLRRQYTIDGLRLVTRATYERIEAPVLQVHGTRDASIPIAAARRLTPRLRDARLVAFEGVGHDVHIERPEELAEVIEGFVAE